MLLAEPLTDRVIGLAIEVHRQTGPGLLESVYEQCLCRELMEAGEHAANSFRQAPPERGTIPLSWCREPDDSIRSGKRRVAR